MEKIEKILPQSFVVINEIPYFRLKSGEIAVETTFNITIHATKEDVVELIYLKFDSMSTCFFRIDDKLYALAGSDSTNNSIDIPKDIHFTDLYSSQNYSQGLYVKYTYLDKCGIFYVSQTQLSHVITLDKGYTDIYFEDGMFYTYSESAIDKYQIINEAGEVIGSFASKVRKVKGYMLFYDDHRIFNQNSEFEVPGGIILIETCLVAYNYLFIKVVNHNGIYYYTKEFEYLVGPIQNAKIECVDYGYYSNSISFFIHEVIDEKIMQTSYITMTKDEKDLSCCTLSSKNGMTIHSLSFNFPLPEKHFIVCDSTVLIYDEEQKQFVSLIEGIANRYTFIRKLRVCHITGFKENKPIYWADYDVKANRIIQKGVFDILDTGWESESYICKTGERILVINQNGDILFSTTGRSCYKKKRRSSRKELKNIYVIDVDDDTIEIKEA